jgi:hypothetical protein
VANPARGVPLELDARGAQAVHQLIGDTITRLQEAQEAARERANAGGSQLRNVSVAFVWNRNFS